MFKKVKEYLEYRKNKKIAKKELTKIAATVLPAARMFSEKKVDTLKFIYRLADSTKKIGSDELVTVVIKELADKLATDQTRLVEIFQYMASLSPDDMRKILIHSAAKTIENKK